MSDIGDWFRSIPAITRYWFAATVAVPLVGKLGLISPAYFFLWPEAFLYRFQIWRPITATFYFPVGPGTGFLYLVNLYFLYQYSTRLETAAFDGRPADYLFMLLFNWICIVITGLAMDMQLLMIPLIMSVLYVWAQLNRDMIVSFWFGTRFKVLHPSWKDVLFVCHCRDPSLQPRDVLSDSSRRGHCRAVYHRPVTCPGLSLDSTISSEAR